ncbi:hypothetical protein [Pseudoxanthomonas wuyuanensis]|uniref:Uncharacterized protein n=1 Tax=Pseudoxanthomonas wuyuanensis TaxID=1073196 RepID=A0A286CUX8_9GAMM|nr:hypothetical protein [Pseudoxanthomonas wuyuanensis]SOD50219.1 hypothetical protein SAMN06296416_1012 [Pseudoxanthomonas wuyuanensis]
MTLPGYWFKSTLFEIEPGEDEEVNPRIYGRQLAHWLKPQLERHGYAVADVFPEDWGWCVECNCESHRLFVACGSIEDFDAKPDDPLPSKESVTWHCFPAAEVPFLSRLLKRIDTGPELSRLDAALRVVLSNESQITLVGEP